MAEVGSMYRVKPHYNVAGGVQLPDVMYKVNRLVPPPFGSQQEESPRSLEERQESLLKQLDAMIAVATSRLEDESASTGSSSGVRMDEILKPNCPVDVVIRANPSQPPLWLGQVKKQMDDKGITTWWKFHTHSSVVTPPSFDSFPANVPHEGRQQYRVIVTVIWSKVGCPSLHIDPCQRSPINGESNIFRFFARLLGIYETSPLRDAIIDLCLDACDVILSHASTNQDRASVFKFITSAIEKGVWFRPGTPQILAVYLASVLSNYGLKNIPQEVLKSWAREYASQLVLKQT